jgi:hypothetical protein
MSWDASKAQAVTVTGADLLVEWHWPDLYFEIDNSAGTITISGASANCSTITSITDPRELLYVGFLMTGVPGDDINLKIDTFSYNEVDPLYIYWYNTDYTGRPDARTVGKFEICELLRVDGKIEYCSNGVPICGADVTLTYVPDPTIHYPPEITNTTVQTQCDANCQDDCRGSYLIYDVVGGYDYCLSAWKDDEYDNAITAFDASLVLRYKVNQLELNCCQKVAADVTGDGCISAYDASHILQYLIDALPNQPYFPKKAADNTNWIFFVDDEVQTPNCPADDDCLSPVEEICYTPLLQSMSNQNFKAAILGDVSGNWGVSTGGKMVVRDINDLCSVEAVSSENGKTVYKITADFGDAYAFQFELSGSTESIQILPVYNSSEWFFQSNTTKENRVLVAAAGTVPSSNVLPLYIVVEDNANNVTLSNLVINESPVTGSLVLKGSGQLPDQYELSDNYPNPFNPATRISFSLPDKVEINLSVYNTLGQHVKTLASGVWNAGKHEVIWDGTNELGKKVASGIYLYRLETADFLETKKMVLLK